MYVQIHCLVTITEQLKIIHFVWSNIHIGNVFQTQVHLNEVCEYVLCANVFNNESFLRNLIKFNLNKNNKKRSRGSSFSTVPNYG
jgi:hypothetical protein